MNIHAAKERRTKVSRACDFCKRRKYKCSGVPPCNLCSKKQIDCVFSIVDKRTTKGSKIYKPSSIEVLSHNNLTIQNSYINENTQRRINKQSSTQVPIARPQQETTASKSPTETFLENNSSTNATEYIPKNLQPLLSFPLKKEEDDQSSEDTSVVEVDKQKSDRTSTANNTPTNRSNTSSTNSNVTTQGLTNNNGNNLRLLYDKDGRLRYIGESSPLSLSYQARKIFRSIRGESEFTDDPDTVNIIDGVSHVRPCKVLQMPKKEYALLLLNLFEANINQTWYIYNREWLNDKFVKVIDDPLNVAPERMATFHLIFSLGLLFAEKSKNGIVEKIGAHSSQFFESGFDLIRNILDDGGLWMTETSLLMYFYYQSTARRSSSWMMLGNAIRNAQALGLHRRAVNESFPNPQYVIHRRKLWKTLYICDRISSILLGRPLTISDYDWDDFQIPRDHKIITGDISTICLDENTRLSKILGHIVQNFYQDGVVNLMKAETMAIELKKWSFELPSIVQIDKILKNHVSYEIESSIRPAMSDNYSILLIHIMQLYGVMLLGKPIFMYLLFKKDKNTSNSITRQQKVLNNFCSASIKASVLTIQAIHIYTRCHPHRIESYVTVNCCCHAAIMLGLTVLYRQSNSDYEKDEYSIEDLMQQLYIAKSILNFYGSTNTISYRLHTIVSRLINTLTLEAQPREENDECLSLPIPTPFQEGDESEPLPRMYQTQVDSKEPTNQGESIFNTPLEHIINFQQFFVPSVTNSEDNNSSRASLKEFERRIESVPRLEDFMYDVGMNDLLLEGRSDSGK
ncbi:unnamed protein product [Candida dubliniensis CD36]|uniref:Zn(2)-C6 fungal-type domain-containing protein n=1 Tax=Candida dubliniensis (strain CD36 / ATCC MYA-646 / CBS 7987 / NCPF 3949 / NRRL Y-17841) TaxID=573826 RepID=B9WFS2_CANDC|nr:uncharacterized protein CD36_42110 [Candida dubliniensis CD36]CAX42091.1 unnamed protein product [Candida dubliniensis CD36]